MILQYRGYNNNWCYEEANTIVWANVNVKGVIDRCKASRKDSEVGSPDADLTYIKRLHKEVNKHIIEETQCCSCGEEDIIFLIGEQPFDDMKNICVVSLKDKGKASTTYVFTSGVYLLNNTGGTVQRLA